MVPPVCVSGGGDRSHRHLSTRLAFALELGCASLTSVAALAPTPVSPITSVTLVSTVVFGHYLESELPVIKLGKTVIRKWWKARVTAWGA
jgi:hypothetical protein